jgi:hypothetical protein
MNEDISKSSEKRQKNRRYALPIKVTYVAVTTRFQDRNSEQGKSTTKRNNNRRYYYLFYLIMMRVKNHQIAPTILVEAA